MPNENNDLKKALFNVSDGILGAAVLIMVGVWFGGWLDGQLKTGPWMSIVFSLIGGGLGLWRLVSKAMSIGGSVSVATKPKQSKPASHQSHSEAGDDSTAPRNPFDRF